MEYYYENNEYDEKYEADYDEYEIDYEDLVFFISESDDDDDDEEYDDSYTKSCKPIPQLSEEVKRGMGIALKGKLNWVTQQPDLKIYPLITTPVKENKHRVKFVPLTKAKILNIKVKHAHHSSINLNEISKSMKREIPLCKFMQAGKLCLYGERCRFKHIPICKKPNCNKKECNLFHINRWQYEEKIRTMKTKYCRNIQETGNCKFGNKCVYAHDKLEIKQNVRPCKYGRRCNLIKQTLRIDRGGNKRVCFRNLINGKYCPNIHDMETIDNYIARTSLSKNRK